jgi:RecB family exonuclease
MTELLLPIGESSTPRPPPFLSHSQISRYLHCPEQYRLYYIEGLRPRYPAANLVFGQILHQALAHLFKEGGDPTRFFLETWEGTRVVELTYSQRDSWEKLRAAGQSLLEKFVREELPRLSSVEAVERGFELDITNLDLPLVGIIDLIADVDDKRTVVDFKSSGSAVEAHEATLSDQLTAYQLAEPQVEQLALCVLVKTKEPNIEWHLTSRSSEQVAEYLSKAELVAREITAGQFYKRPGKWCGWCDFLPVCIGDRTRAQESLVQHK